MSDVDFSQVKGVRIKDGEAKYIVDEQNLLWRKPNEFPYVIGAYTTTNNAGNTYEYFSPYYIETYQEPVPVKATYLPTYNSNINTSNYLMATPSLAGTLLNGYYCQNETDCQNLHIPNKRKYLGYYAYTYWQEQSAATKKILVYASKGQTQMLINSIYPQPLEGVPTLLKYRYTPPLYLGTGFAMPYGEVETPELCRVLDTTIPILTITFPDGNTIGASNEWYPQNMIKAVREDYSELIEKYDQVTSGAYPKSEYPYLDGVTELSFNRSHLGNKTTDWSRYVFAFYVFFRVPR
ncbi:MAG: hypothetical protein IJM68_00610 [Synergistaceae bacterium]|nr:hypothetical protein [Synergistaceae bacterium]